MWSAIIARVIGVDGTNTFTKKTSTQDADEFDPTGEYVPEGHAMLADPLPGQKYVALQSSQA